MKISYFLLAFSFLIFTACGDDDSTKEMLIGSWDLAQVTGDGMLTTTVGEENDLAVSSGAVSYVLTFTEGSYITAGSYDLTNEIIDANGIKVFEPLQYTNVSGNSSYSIDDNMLTSGGPFIGILIAGINLGAMATEQISTLEFVSEDEMIITYTQKRVEISDGNTKTVVLTIRSVWTKR